MRQIVEVISGIFVLIIIYLFLSHGTETAGIIRAISSNAVQGIKVLQGRG